MEHIVFYAVLFVIIVIVGQLFSKATVPISMVLVVTGMLLSQIPSFPTISLNPEVVLNIFLPLLIYQISAYSSWKDVRKNVRPIALLSVGHIIFIATLVAVIIHTLLPQLGWPLAFVLGAVISPPDSVAIVSVAEKIRMPKKLVTILEGEGMLNDATALILFRFALAAVVTHEFHPVQAITAFFTVIAAETLYGLALGFIVAELRMRISNTRLNILASLLTPFLAYWPAEQLGGCGVLATVVAGFVIGHVYAMKFTPEFRVVSRAVWPALTFAIESILFLLVGLNMKSILRDISVIPTEKLALYSIAVVLTVIIGRFIWVYGFVTYFPRIMSSVRKKEPFVPWQYPFVTAWAGMRGGISLAAALAVPALPAEVHGANSRDLLIFLVFCVIAATLLFQGLSLPWILKKIGISKFEKTVKSNQKVVELTARIKITQAVLRWLAAYKGQVKDNPKLLEEVKLYFQEYRLLKTKLNEKIGKFDGDYQYDEKEKLMNESFLLSQIIEVERSELLMLWQKEEIDLKIRDKLLERLDHRAKHLLD